ncbi:hypothetical protein A6V39_00615 [Candidatus Mycoplasma haematobovis]|uniref:Uncharacterized protein n=1 Tax=Candidatus Mycoplasma haematobovis TaxID=432608 RepID=A0A1A9QDL1_9MOLU|nr:hypothetical protein [Candidatus Mycoplasma haematobovis]OAL10553.1 hypothetical protein A6V39_00615 [Candidatus Mycoplasma haematobovis]
MRLKSAIATTAISLVGGAGAGAYAGGLLEFINNGREIILISSTSEKSSPLRDKLEEEGFKVLDTSQDSDEWKEVLAEYRKATTRSFTGVSDAHITEAQLRSRCAEHLKQKSNAGHGYSLARQWCVKKEKMINVFKRGKRRILNVDTLTRRDFPLWERKLKELQRNKTKFKNISVPIEESERAKNENINAIKKECWWLDIDGMETTSDMFETNFKLAWKLCSVKQNPNELSK